MDKYIVVDVDGKEISPGDLIKDFRGNDFIFVRLSRGPEYNGTSKVTVRFPEGDELDFYHTIFGFQVLERDDQ